MRTRTIEIALTLAAALFVSSCATIQSNPVASEVTPDAYAKSKSAKGVAVMAVNWERRWKCGSFENAEVMSLGFDRLPVTNSAPEAPASVFIDGPPRLAKKRGFENYALLLEPGEYALSSFDVKVARSVSDVGHFAVGRKNLIVKGEPKGGSFKVDAGEIVYVGNFFVECLPGSATLWRFYTEGHDGFGSHMNEFKQKYPFLDLTTVQYRLFRTSVIGQDYELK